MDSHETVTARTETKAKNGTTMNRTASAKAENGTMSGHGIAKAKVLMDSHETVKSSTTRVRVTTVVGIAITQVNKDAMMRIVAAMGDHRPVKSADAIRVMIFI